MPASISKGQTLPVPTVSSSKNYTLTAFWGMLEGDQVTKAEEDGIYLLVYTVTPKAGYTFNEPFRTAVSPALAVQALSVYQPVKV